MSNSNKNTKKYRLENLIGKKSGNLTAIEFAGKDHRNNYLVKCRCICGNTHTITASRFRNKIIRSCGCSTKLLSGEAAFNDLFAKYKYRAEKILKVQFKLTKNEFKMLTKSNCFYSGHPPIQTTSKKHYNGIYLYNGIDRIDNSKGYTLTNVVPCCKICNYAKLNLEQQIFENWIKDLVRFKINEKKD